MSRTIYIGRECFHVEGPEHFANILEEKLGRDAAELFREYLQEYRNAIENAIDDLECISCTNSATNDAFLDTTLGFLREVIL